MGGATLSGERSNWGKSERRNLYFGWGGINKTASVPNGYSGSYAVVMAPKTGGMASYTLTSLTLAKADAILAAGKNLDASVVLSLVVTNAQLDQVVPLSATGTTTLTVSNLEMAAAVLAEGTGTLTLTVSSALLGGIFDVGASGTLTLSPNVTMTALAHLEAEAGGATPLSPEGLSAQLLDAEDVEAGFTVREALRLILSSVGGKLSGAGSATITIRNVTDTANRIIATVDSNGNRETVTYDVGD